MLKMERQIKAFYSICSVVLGSIVGVLFAVPISIKSVFDAPILIVFFGFVGAYIGYKKRENHGFFYFLLVCVLILGWILYLQGFQVPVGAKPT